MVLHVGSGPANPEKLHRLFHGPGWQEVRLDINPDVAPDIVASMTDMSVVPSGRFDAIWSSHNLEHLSAHEVPVALAEFCRVLRPDGFAVITLPDLQSVARLVAEDRLLEPAYEAPAGPVTPLDMLYGWRTSIAKGNPFMAHRTGFTARTLGEMLAAGGFQNVQVCRGEAFDLWAIASRRAVNDLRFGGMTPAWSWQARASAA